MFSFLVLALAKRRNIKLTFCNNIFITLINVENVQRLQLAKRDSTIIPLEFLILGQ